RVVLDLRRGFVLIGVDENEFHALVRVVPIKVVNAHDVAVGYGADGRNEHHDGRDAGRDGYLLTASGRECEIRDSAAYAGLLGPCGNTQQKQGAEPNPHTTSCLRF